MSLVDNATGVIEPGRLYTAAEAKRRLKLGPKTWRDLKRDGMKIVSRGRHQFVTGDELIRVLSPVQGTDNNTAVQTA